MSNLRLLLVLLLLLSACSSSIGPRAAAPIPPPPEPVELHLTLHPSVAQPGPDGPTFDGALWVPGSHLGLLSYPIPVQPGDQILRWDLAVQRDTLTPLGPTVGARLERLAHDGADVEHVSEGATDTRRVTGPFMLLVKLDPPHVVEAGFGYVLQAGGDGVPGDRLGDASVTILR